MESVTNFLKKLLDDVQKKIIKCHRKLLKAEAKKKRKKALKHEKKLIRLSLEKRKIKDMYNDRR